MNTNPPAVSGSLRRLRSGRDSKTNAYRLVHGQADGWKDLYVDRLGDFLLMQSPLPLTEPQIDAAKDWKNALNLKGVYYKKLNRMVQTCTMTSTSPRLVMGLDAPEVFDVLENGLTFRLSLNQGYSTGLFLDMRENRQRILRNTIEPGFPVFESAPANASVLNCFSYTCAFSVCAARAGASTTNLDLSRKYLDWGRDNMRRNRLDPDQHDFIYGDALDWMKRLAKRGDKHELVILDPPTFSRSKKSGLFLAKRDFASLAKAATQLVRNGGMLLACCNAAGLPGKKFKEDVRKGIRFGGRKTVRSFDALQPPDFPATAKEPAYLKVSWLRLD
ncbi:MAG: class I SAM-dependent rRNA methyltransferase [Pedosphaera sp.]|nr:class I SAM-dependent rRNA methyltransferase [Pedosphaera sp.]